ncbi:MAG: threonine synthase [Lachnospirales bacterium]
MIFKSTRSTEEVKDYEALINGIAKDGGLYMPKEFPKVNINNLMDLNYINICSSILGLFFDIEEIKLKNYIEKSYSKFTKSNIVPVKKFDDFAFIELFHGPTLAFKDIALSMLPHLLSDALSRKNTNENLLILTATSGDTGSAALEGFKNIPNIKIIVLYPEIGVSHIQELQMLNIDGDNTKVFSIKGNFDDAQSKVKELFADNNIFEIGKEHNRYLSSANSINIGRLLPQVVYYFHSYIDLIKNKKIKMGDKIDIAVPTGNFGNILASYFAKLIGLPVDKFICASNKNNVLTDFFETGVYDINRDFYVTSSPSMDILISSNLERLLYLKLGEEKTKEIMLDLKNTNKYKVDKNIFSDFISGCCSESETESEIKYIYEKFNYVVDPHTAVASFVQRKLKAENKTKNYCLITSTASPYKFPKVIGKSLNISDENEFQLIRAINKKTKCEIPQVIYNLENKKITKNTIDINNVKNNVIEFIK